MTRVTVRNVGAIGVVPDLDQPPHEMPPEAWSRVENINFTTDQTVTIAQQIDPNYDAGL